MVSGCSLIEIGMKFKMDYKLSLIFGIVILLIGFQHLYFSYKLDGTILSLIGGFILLYSLNKLEKPKKV